MLKKKIVLCRPLGGLTDRLTQIEKCFQYAQKFDRTLVVDTNFSKTKEANYKLSDFFTSKHNNLVCEIEKTEHYFDHLSVYPKVLEGIVNSYECTINSKSNVVIDVSSREAITFDFNKEYIEDVLIHQQWGSSPLFALNGLKRFKLSKKISTELTKRINQMGGEFDAIHIRNTDMKTNYLQYINEISSCQFQKLFLATDDLNVLNAFKSRFEDKIISFSFLPNNGGQPLHYSSQDYFVMMQDAICDLMMLGLSRQLFLCEVYNVPWTKYSGFSLLAKLINQNKTIVSELMY